MGPVLSVPRENSALTSCRWSGRARADYGVRVSRSSARGFVAKADLSGDAPRRVLCDEERNER